MQEEAPLTPVRLGLTAASTILLAGEIYLLTHEQWGIWLVITIVIDLMVLVGGYKAATYQMRRLISN